MGLAFVYGPMLGAWFFPFMLGLFGVLSVTGRLYGILATLAAVLGGLFFTLHLIRLDDEDGERWKAAGKDLPT